MLSHLHKVFGPFGAFATNPSLCRSCRSVNLTCFFALWQIWMRGSLLDIRWCRQVALMIWWAVFRLLFYIRVGNNNKKKNNRLQSIMAINLPVVIHSSFTSQHRFLLRVIPMSLVFLPVDLLRVGTERRHKYSGYKRADHSFCSLRRWEATFLMRCMSGHGLDTHSSPRPPTGVCVRYSSLHSLTALPTGSVSLFPLRLPPPPPTPEPTSHSSLRLSSPDSLFNPFVPELGWWWAGKGRWWEKKKKARSLSIPLSLDSSRVPLRSCYRQQMAKSDIYCESSAPRANVSCANRLLSQHGM